MAQMSSLATFGTYAVIASAKGYDFDTITIFASLAIMKIITSPLLETLQYIAIFISALTSLTRVQEFLDGFGSARSTDRSSEVVADSQVKNDLQDLELQPRKVHGTRLPVIEVSGFVAGKHRDGVMHTLHLQINPSGLTIINGRFASKLVDHLVKNLLTNDRFS